MTPYGEDQGQSYGKNSIWDVIEECLGHSKPQEQYEWWQREVFLSWVYKSKFNTSHNKTTSYIMLTNLEFLKNAGWRYWRTFGTVVMKLDLYFRKW